jgi:hypothetical protein
LVEIGVKQTESLQPLFTGLGLPNTDLALEAVLGTIKDGVVPRRFASDTEFSPYNAGMLVLILRAYGEGYASVVEQIFAQMDDRLRNHFPDADGRSLNHWANMPVIGTSRVLQAYVALGRTSAPHFQHALRWVLKNQNADGGFGLNEGDYSRMFATSVVTELLASIGSYADELHKIRRFVMDSYDGTTGCWGVHAGKKPEVGMSYRSPSALAVQTWRCLGARGVLEDSRSREFESVMGVVTRKLAEDIENSVQHESGSIDLRTVESVPLFHFVLVEVLTALLASGVEPWSDPCLRGLRRLSSLQGSSGQFRYGIGVDELIWASIEALRLLQKVEAKLAGGLEGLGREAGQKMAPPGSEAGSSSERGENQFKADAKEFCEQELIPKLSLKMHAYGKEGFFMTAEKGWLRKKVRVMLEHSSKMLTEEFVVKWVGIAEKGGASLLVVLASQPADIKAWRALWKHNNRSSHPIELWVV